MRPIVATFIAFAIMQSITTALAQHSLKGMVADREGPIEFVNLTIPSLGSVTITDVHGSFEFKDLPAGVV